MSLRIDLVRKGFDRAMIEAVTAFFGGDASRFQWLGVNASLVPDHAGLQIVTALLPGRAVSQELGLNGALALRDGVYTVTQSIPKGKSVDESWRLAGALEARFRRVHLVTVECRVWCDEPYTENRGTDPEQGRYLLSTTIPWSAVY